MEPNPTPPVIGVGEDIAPGTIIAGFSAVLPCSDETCRANIAASLERGLPDALQRHGLYVIANGPSALAADLANLTLYPTLALNGAIKLFTDKGLAPTYWACCDPQELVADLLPDEPPLNTIYFVASKCHPAVFAKLKGRDVRLWHLMDYAADGRARVALASSITISASWFFHRLGFTDFEYHGWDGCFMGERHHAAESHAHSAQIITINYAGELVDGEVIGGRNFATTRSWALEANGATQFFQLANYFDIGVTIHGDGMFRATRDYMLQKAN